MHESILTPQSADLRFRRLEQKNSVTTKKGFAEASALVLFHIFGIIIINNTIFLFHFHSQPNSILFSAQPRKRRGYMGHLSTGARTLL